GTHLDVDMHVLAWLAEKQLDKRGRPFVAGKRACIARVLFPVVDAGPLARQVQPQDCCRAQWIGPDALLKIPCSFAEFPRAKSSHAADGDRAIGVIGAQTDPRVIVGDSLLISALCEI